MMNLDDMPEICGGLNPVIDFKENLSVKGKRFFVDGLKAWQLNLRNKLAVKFENLSEKEIAQEKENELEAYIACSLQHDPEIGPISIIHSQTQIAQVDKTCEFIWGNNRFFDTELYEYLGSLLPSPKFKMTQQTDPSEELPEDVLDLDELSDEQETGPMMSIEKCADSVGHFAGLDAIYHVFRLYRLSQFDILEKVEKGLLLSELRGSYEDTYLSEYNLKQTAINQASILEVEEKLNEIHEGHLPYVAFKQGESFLHLYHDFQKQLKLQQEAQINQNNAYTYLVALRVTHAFENLQIIIQESHQNISYDDLLEQLNDDRYTSFMIFDSYEEYYQTKGENTRFPILHPEDVDAGISSGELHALDYADFTNNCYDAMSDEGKKDFVNYMQTKLDKYAKHLKMPSVDLTELHPFVSKYAQPSL